MEYERVASGETPLPGSNRTTIQDVQNTFNTIADNLDLITVSIDFPTQELANAVADTLADF